MIQSSFCFFKEFINESWQRCVLNTVRRPLIIKKLIFIINCQHMVIAKIDRTMKRGGKIENSPHCRRLLVMNKMCEHHLALNRLPQTNGRLSSYCYSLFTHTLLSHFRILEQALMMMTMMMLMHSKAPQISGYSCFLYCFQLVLDITKKSPFLYF